MILDYFFVNNETKVMNGMEVFEKIKDLSLTCNYVVRTGKGRNCT